MGALNGLPGLPDEGALTWRGDDLYVKRNGRPELIGCIRESAYHERWWHVYIHGAWRFSFNTREAARRQLEARAK